MAGMAWTLHPALFYEKYGTVLVQLWDSGALGALFLPLRRLSKTIGEAVAAGLSQLPRVSDASKADAEDSKALLIDDTEVTEDEACRKVNRGPGDTSPEPSTSEENELAFQGDLYTRLRRSRRQKERLKKIRESQKQILGDDSTSSTSDTGRRKKRRRRSHAVPVSNRALRKEFGQKGTPLTDMSGAAPRGVVLDVSDTSSNSTPSKDETAGDVGAGGVRKTTPVQLLADKDNFKKFRGISGTKKRAPASPPPGVQPPSLSTPSETASVAIDAAGGPVTGGAAPTCAQAPISFGISPFNETEAKKIADLPALENTSSSPSTESPGLPFSRVPEQMSFSSPENIGSRSDEAKLTDDDAGANERSPFEFTHDLADECAMKDRDKKLRLAAQACPESEEMSPPYGYGLEISPALPDNSKEEERPGPSSTAELDGWKATAEPEESRYPAESRYPDWEKPQTKVGNIENGAMVNIKSTNVAAALAPLGNHLTGVGADTNPSLQSSSITQSGSDTSSTHKGSKHRPRRAGHPKTKAKMKFKGYSLQGSELHADKTFAAPNTGVGTKGTVGEHCTGTLSSAACNKPDEAGGVHAAAGGPKEICSKSAHKIPHKHKKHHHKKRHHKMHIAEKPETVPPVKPSGSAQVVPHEDMWPSETADNADSAILEAASKRHRHSKKHKKRAKHGRRRSSKEKKSKEGKKAASAQATSISPTTSGASPSGKIAEGTAEHPVKALEGVEGASRVVRLLPSMDTTSATHSSLVHSDLEHQTRNAALIEGKNVTVHLDVSSAHKKHMFWPFVTKKGAK